MITGTADSTSFGVFDIDVLVESLTEKYGLAEKSGSPMVRSWTFGECGSAHLTIFGGETYIVYRYEKLIGPLQQKIQQQKDEQFKKTLNGI
jgi:hypothetical protein